MTCTIFQVISHLSERFFGRCARYLPRLVPSTCAYVIRRMKKATASTRAEDTPEPKKRKVLYSTYKKWRHDFDHNCQTVTWLRCEMEITGGKWWVKCLTCTVCTKYKDRFVGRREHWITEADSLRTSNICDHAHSD